MSFASPTKAIFFSCIAVMLCFCSCHKEYIYQTDFRSDIPLNILYHPLNNPYLVTPYVTITINGVQNDVLFDTGSQGLRLLAGALHGTAVDTDKEQVTYSYGYDASQLFIQGAIAGAGFTIGKLSGHSPVKFMRIDDTATSKNGPWGSVRNLANYDNAHFRGLSGIMGVGLRPGGSGIANPLAQLPGNGSYIVEFPKYGDPQGHLIINPHDNERAGFDFFQLDTDATLLPNGYNSWNDYGLYGSLLIDNTPLDYYTLLDSGSPYTELFGSNLPFYGLQSGKHIEMRLRHSATGAATVFNDFQASSNPTVGVDYVGLYSSSGTAHMSYGTNLFFAFDVLFDQAKGVIGIRKKQ
jgi:hypothetical protein